MGARFYHKGAGAPDIYIGWAVGTRCGCVGWARARVKKVDSFPYITRVIELGDWDPVLFEMLRSSQAGARIKLGVHTRIGCS